MENKQTAVEWFWLNLTDDLIGDLAPEKILKIYKLIEQAKAMEKEQMIEFAEKYANSDAFYCSGEFDIEKGAEQYYNETFKSE